MLVRLVCSAGVVLTLVGCAPEATSCPLIEGTFEPVYQKLDGDCATACGEGEGEAGAAATCFMPLGIAFPGAGPHAREFAPPADRVEDNIIYKGCSIGIQQLVVEGNVRREEMQGDVEIIDTDELRGVLNRTEYDETTVACEGSYEVVLRRGGG